VQASEQTTEEDNSECKDVGRRTVERVIAGRRRQGECRDVSETCALLLALVKTGYFRRSVWQR